MKAEEFIRSKRLIIGDLTESSKKADMWNTNELFELMEEYVKSKIVSDKEIKLQAEIEREICQSISNDPEREEYGEKCWIAGAEYVKSKLS